MSKVREEQLDVDLVNQTDLYSASGTLNTKVDTLDTKVDNLDTKVDNLETDLELQVYDASGYILSTVNTNLYSASGTIIDYIDAVSGSISMSGGASYMDDLIDADTTTDAPVKNETLKWNGSLWVPAVYNYDFAFSIATFADDQAATQLIGTGVWRPSAELNFTASYINGPPTSGSITLAGTSGWSLIELSTPFTSATTAAGTFYPAAKDSTVTCTLAAINTEYDTAATTVVFRNHVIYGPTTGSSGYWWDMAAFDYHIVTSTYTGNFSNAGCPAGYWMVFAHPSSYTTLHPSGFRLAGVTCPFELPETKGYTNPSGYFEDYECYRSTNKGLGTQTLYTSTTSALLNPIFYGVSTESGTYDEADVSGLASSTISNTKGRTIVVTAAAGEYIVYTLPMRLGTVVFTVGGFEGGFESPQTLNMTNRNGFVEAYYLYRSTQSGLGVTTVVIT